MGSFSSGYFTLGSSSRGNNREDGRGVSHVSLSVLDSFLAGQGLVKVSYGLEKNLGRAMQAKSGILKLNS